MVGSQAALAWLSPERRILAAARCHRRPLVSKLLCVECHACMHGRCPFAGRKPCTHEPPLWRRSFVNDEDDVAAFQGLDVALRLGERALDLLLAPLLLLGVHAEAELLVRHVDARPLLLQVAQQLLAVALRKLCRGLALILQGFRGVRAWGGKASGTCMCGLWRKSAERSS
jgi:hypothetical protein